MSRLPTPARSRPVSSHSLVRAALRSCLVLVGLAAATACDGPNAFRNPPTGPPTGGGSPDTERPEVTIEFPLDSATVAVADSVFVRARVRDDGHIETVIFEGFIVRGDPALGTDTRVDRFVTKTVTFPAGGGAVEDTTLTRYLNATADSLTERGVLIVVTAVDSAGNTDADSVGISIGGPRVAVVTPAQGTQFRGGTTIPVRVQAQDAIDLIRQVNVRVTGAFTAEIPIVLATPAAALDSVVNIPVPNVQGNVTVEAIATSGSNITAVSRPVGLVITAPQPDVTAPRVSFSFNAPPRAETLDSILVVVSATDETRVDSVGATLLVRFRDPATGGQVTQTLVQKTQAAADSFRFALSTLGLPQVDTTTLAVEVTAWATDPAGNCGAATAPNVVQSLPCTAPTAAGARFAQGLPGRLANILIARGITVPFPAAGDRIADLASDGARVFASNFTRNRVEVLPIGALLFGSPVRVGSQPWGLAVGSGNDQLFVANSGSTTISRVPLSASLPPAENTADRIQTPNVQLFEVKFALDESGRVRLQITPRDFSDRPQFIAHTAGGRLLYSTKPTSVARPGTLRQYDPASANQPVRLFIDYATGSVPGTFVVRDAEVVTKKILGTVESPTDQLIVCDRHPGDASDTCFPSLTGDDDMTFVEIQNALTSAGFDAVMDFNIDPAKIALRDTTFVAISGDRSTVAFGEGAGNPGRIISYAETGTGVDVRLGNTSDLVNNAAERVVGLALNPNGTLGAARGAEAYLFNRELRLQGVIETGAPAGGVALHPGHDSGDPLRRLAFISGEENGVPFIDIVDTFHSDSRRRVVLRDPITGTLIAVPRRAGDPADLAMRLYGITASGIVAIDIFNDDLAP